MVPTATGVTAFDLHELAARRLVRSVLSTREMRSFVLALLLSFGVVGLVGGSAEAGKRVDWSAYLESPSERAAAAAPVAPEARPKATAKSAKAKRLAKAKTKAKARKRARRK